MPHIGEITWSCNRCRYRVTVQDANGKPVKKVPVSCPSCGHKCGKDCSEHGTKKFGPSSRD